MSHHFDTPTAREDPRINVCDFYLFEGAPGATVMAMTVNPDAGLSAPDSFREEGLYAFRFDLALKTPSEAWLPSLAHCTRRRNSHPSRPPIGGCGGIGRSQNREAVMRLPIPA